MTKPFSALDSQSLSVHETHKKSQAHPGGINQTQAPSLWSLITWVQVPALPFVSWVILGQVSQLLCASASSSLQQGW